MSAEQYIGGVYLPEMLLTVCTPWGEARLRAHTATSSTYMGRSGSYILENVDDAKSNRIMALGIGTDGHRQKLEKLRRISAGGAQLVGVIRGDEFRVCIESWADVVEFLTTHTQDHWRWLVKAVKN